MILPKNNIRIFVSLLLFSLFCISFAGRLSLCPQVRQIEYQPGQFVPEPGGFVCFTPTGDARFAGISREVAGSMNLVSSGWQPRAVLDESKVPDGNVVLLKLSTRKSIDQSYQLTISNHTIQIESSSLRGLWYGAQTLRQVCMLSRSQNRLPALTISDWPDILDRGMMIDVSRRKVPKMETLKSLIDLLSHLKYNQVQLYMEHSFEYLGHEVVWQDASALSSRDLLELDRYCRERFIELVPNQNCFGHMERWIEHPQYAHLAECSENCPEHIEPRTLCPIDPGSIDLVADLFNQLLPNFQSEKFNVGCDETFELGKGRSADIVEEKGKGRVYLDYLLKVHELCLEHNRRMMFWGDIILEHPELIAELPADAIPLNWGYEADHAYSEQCPKFEEANLTYYVCPGTSSWNSITGRTDVMIGNLKNAAQNGIKHGARGYLLTDWGDRFGHLQTLPVLYPAVVYGAGLAWSYKDNVDMDIQKQLSQWVFHEPEPHYSKALYDLGNVYQAADAYMFNGSRLFWILTDPKFDPQKRKFKGFTVEKLQAAIDRIDEIVDAFDRTEAEMDRPDSQLLTDELRLAARLLRHACLLGMYRLQSESGKLSPEQDQKNRYELTQDILAVTQEHQRIWLKRNRPGGLVYSVKTLLDIERSYR